MIKYYTIEDTDWNDRPPMYEENKFLLWVVTLDDGELYGWFEIAPGMIGEYLFLNCEVEYGINTQLDLRERG